MKSVIFKGLVSLCKNDDINPIFNISTEMVLITQHQPYTTSSTKIFLGSLVTVLHSFSLTVKPTGYCVIIKHDLDKPQTMKFTQGVKGYEFIPPVTENSFDTESQIFYNKYLFYSEDEDEVIVNSTKFLLE